MWKLSTTLVFCDHQLILCLRYLHRQQISDSLYVFMRPAACTGVATCLYQCSFSSLLHAARSTRTLGTAAPRQLLPSQSRHRPGDTTTTITALTDRTLVRASA